MTKEQFIIHMRTLHTMMEEEEQMLKVLNCNPENTMSSWISHYFDLFRECAEDTNDWIAYYAYELDFGKRWFPECVTDKNGNYLPCKTPSDIWDRIQEDNETPYE